MDRNNFAYDRKSWALWTGQKELGIMNRKNFTL